MSYSQNLRQLTFRTRSVHIISLGDISVQPLAVFGYKCQIGISKRRVILYGAPETIVSSPIIRTHTAVALFAVIAGAVVLCMRKGTKSHKFVGRLWVISMLFVTLSSFAIGDELSFIHGISVFTITMIYIGFWFARFSKNPHRRKKHAGFMIGSYIGLWSAGVPAIITPGRLIADMLGF